MKKIFLLSFILLFFAPILFAQGLTIQENELGFCSVDGIIDTDVAGYTGDGFANTGPGIGASILWNINAPADGDYQIFWRYANGGGSGDLMAEVWVNETPVVTAFNFEHTGSWTNWIESDTLTLALSAGENKIRLYSLSDNGLVNLDYLQVIEDGLTGAFCVPSYAFNLSKNLDAGGDIFYEPVQAFYDAGTEITLTANTNAGYFFQSWSEGETSVDAVHTFNIDKNTNVEALFYPDGTVAEEGVIGYATVQDDDGTPYLMTGGLFGDTVLATGFASLKNFLESDLPYVVTVADHIVSTGTISIKSDKTLLGITDSAHLEGIRIKINSADNVIIRNMTFSKVIQFDAIEINNSRHIWIDGSVFFTDKDNGPEYYDGLLDIKNTARFITVSGTEFRDHFKSILISSGDDSFQDTVVRITFHHNYFHHLGSRTPLLRFGKAHVFNNYFKNCNSGINSRMDACIRVENNFFYHVSNATRTDMSIMVGSFELIDNIFESSTYVTEPTCELAVPYEYLSILDEAAAIPLLVGGEDPLSIDDDLLDLKFDVFPNPTEGEVQVQINFSESMEGSLILYDALGQVVKLVFDGRFQLGENHLSFSVQNHLAGIYYLQIKTADGIATRRLIVN